MFSHLGGHRSHIRHIMTTRMIGACGMALGAAPARSVRSSRHALCTPSCNHLLHVTENCCTWVHRTVCYHARVKGSPAPCAQHECLEPRLPRPPEANALPRRTLPRRPATLSGAATLSCAAALYPAPPPSILRRHPILVTAPPLDTNVGRCYDMRCASTSPSCSLQSAEYGGVAVGKLLPAKSRAIFVLGQPESHLTSLTRLKTTPLIGCTASLAL